METYKGPKFTKEQLIFTVEAVLLSVLDRIESTLPSTLGMNDFDPDVTEEHLNTSIEMGSWILSVYISNIIDDGVEIFEASEAMNWEGFIRDFVQQNVARKGEIPPGAKYLPDITDRVRIFVESIFGDYLKE